MSIESRIQRLEGSGAVTGIPRVVGRVICDRGETAEEVWARDYPGKPYPTGDSELLIVRQIVTPGEDHEH